MALFQERLGRGDLLGRVAVKLVVGQGVADGVVIDLHVGQQIEQGGLVLEGGAEVVDLLAEFLDAGLQLGAVGGGNGDAGRRDGADLVGQVVAGAVGADGGGREGQGGKGGEPVAVSRCLLGGCCQCGKGPPSRAAGAFHEWYGSGRRRVKRKKGKNENGTEIR